LGKGELVVEWGGRHDWVLLRFYSDLTRVTSQFQCAKPSLSELTVIRRCLPQYRDMSPTAARASIGESGQLTLGVLPTPEARQIIGKIQGVGLTVNVEGASDISYFPHDKTTGCGLVIEDEGEARAVVQSVLDAGAPVSPVEA
jgi:hypothetical protein